MDLLLLNDDDDHDDDDDDDKPHFVYIKNFDIYVPQNKK